MKRTLLNHSLVLLLAASVLVPSVAYPGGFNIYEQGSRATALGGAFTATADDPSALFYNMAGTAFLREGWALSVNVSPVLPRNKFTRAMGRTAIDFPGDPTAETKDAVFFPTGIYVTYRHDDIWSAGFSFSTPYGLGVEWDNQSTFSGRTESVNAQIEGLYFSPSVTFSPWSHLAIAGGFSLVKTSLELNSIRTTTFGTDNTTYNIADVTLEGTSRLGVGPNAAIMYRPSDRWSFGVNYRGGVLNEFRDDDAEFVQRTTGIGPVDDAVAAELAFLNTKSANADIEFPAILMTGARYEVNEDFGLMVDFIWFDWSSFEEIRLVFSDPDIVGGDPTSVAQVIREDYSDGQQWRFGAEYRISPKLRGMVGFAYDNTPQPTGSVSPLLPDANRLDYSLGLTWEKENLEITAGYMFVDFDERSTVVDGVGQSFEGFDGTYTALVHIPTIGFSYYF